jgi:hypothetical protein
MTQDKLAPTSLWAIIDIGVHRHDQRQLSTLADPPRNACEAQKQTASQCHTLEGLPGAQPNKEEPAFKPLGDRPPDSPHQKHLYLMGSNKLAGLDITTKWDWVPPTPVVRQFSTEIINRVKSQGE